MITKPVFLNMMILLYTISQMITIMSIKCLCVIFYQKSDNYVEKYDRLN
jgi:hypothetical protein